MLKCWPLSDRRGSGSEDGRKRRRRRSKAKKRRGVWVRASGQEGGIDGSAGMAHLSFVRDCFSGSVLNPATVFMAKSCWPDATSETSS